jgi:hypothetical protein
MSLSYAYEPLPLDKLQQAIEALELENLPSENNFENYLLSQKIKEALLKAKLYVARGTQAITSLSSSLYNLTFPSEIVNYAHQDATLPHAFVSQEIATGQEAGEAVSRYLIQNNILDWQVEVTDKHDFFFRILPKARKILVSEVVNWDFCDLDNTLAHEIDGHVFRALNMHAQSNPLFQKPLPFYIKTEEGLASFMGDYLSTTAKLGRKHHALKYLAGQYSLTHSFRETYQFLIERWLYSCHCLSSHLSFKTGDGKWCNARSLCQRSHVLRRHARS